MMPRTAHCIFDQNALGKWAMVMRAVGVDSEDLPASPNQQHLLLGHVADNAATIRKIVERYAKRQIWACRMIFVTHQRVLAYSGHVFLHEGEMTACANNGQMNQMHRVHDLLLEVDLRRDGALPKPLPAKSERERRCLNSFVESQWRVFLFLRSMCAPTAIDPHVPSGPADSEHDDRRRFSPGSCRSSRQHRSPTLLRRSWLRARRRRL